MSFELFHNDCSKGNDYMEHLTFKAMGTTINLKIQHRFAAQLLTEAKKRLFDFEQRFSANNNNSMLMQVNQYAGIKPIKVDKDIYELIEIGKKYSLDDNNSLNVAIGPLVKLWKIGFKDANVPTQSEIDERLSLINPRSIILNEKEYSVYLENKGMEIDLGSLAKGFFADRIKDFLLKEGVTEGIIDLGGNILLIGSHPTNSDKLWRVGIQNPFKTRQKIVGILQTQDRSVVTSGIYERSLQINGKEYHHIFDSQTGYPINNDVASITIVSKKSLTAELYTTMLYKYESKQIISFINQLPEIEGIVITKDNEIICSEELQSDFILIN